MTTHNLTEEMQGEYHYTVGPYADPVLEIEPGDTVEVETHDAFEGAIETEDDLPSEVLGDYLNPQNGPIYVEGAEPGDAIAITIESIEPRGPQPRGTTCTVPYFGGLSATDRTAMLHDPLPEIVKKLEVTTDGTVWNDDITIPYEPFIGTISTSPEINSVDALTPFKHGGNMDLPDVCPGNTIYLPVEVEGGYVYLGDCHAAQGDGEVCVSAIETPTEITARLTVRPDLDVPAPQFETAGPFTPSGRDEPAYATTGVRDDLMDAASDAVSAMLDRLVARYDLSRPEAYVLCSVAADLKINEVVDAPNWVVSAYLADSLFPDE